MSTRDGEKARGGMAALQRFAEQVQGVALFALDAEGRISDWPAAAAAIFGHTAAEACGEPLELLRPGRDGDAHDEILIDAAATGQWEGLEQWRGRDGAARWVEVTLTALRDGSRVTGYGVLARSREIPSAEQEAAAEEALEALRRSEARFAGIVALATDGIVSVDEAQRITLFNAGAEAIFGYRAEEVLGQHLNMLLPPRAHEIHERRHMPAFAASPVAARRMGERSEVYGVRKNGEEFPAEASISKQHVGGRWMYTAVLRDVSERHQAEQALAAKAAELARSNAELAQFAYVASHDLQEPLRMVASYTQLLARRYGGKLDADADEFIGFAVDGVTRMQALINDLLALSRVGTRGRPFAPTDLESVLAETLATLAPAIEESGGVVEHDPLPVVRGDAGQLEQLFRNLIGNGLKFRGDEPPRVHVGARRGEGEWIFSVRDNGIGLDMQYAERIFQMFQRLHGRAEYPGTGIGLAICKKIVERHGGSIRVQSEPRAGSLFEFSIPDRPPADAAAAEP